MDNSPVFSNPQKQTETNWGKAGLIAGLIAFGSAILFILIVSFSTGAGFGNISLSIIVLGILGGLATLSSLTGIVLSIIGIGQNKAKAIAGITLNIILLFLVGLMRNAFVPIQPDECAVVISAFQPYGYRPEALGPGLHWILPFVESPRVYSVAPQTYSMASSSNPGDDSIQVRTRDGQRLTISVSVTYSIDPAKVLKLHILWQDRYQENVVRPVVRATIRDMASEYTALEIMGPARSAMEQATTERLYSLFAENDLILIHFEITDIHQ